MDNKDIIIIGGGSAGYTAAIRAAQLNAKVTLVEKDKIGGTCLNYGCIPTKTLYRNAEIINNIKNSQTFGVNIENYTIDINKIHERKNNVINTLKKGIEQLIKLNKIEYIQGKGFIKNKNTVIVENENKEKRTINAKNIIIATGSKPSIPPISGIDERGILTSSEILDFKKIPESLTIVGGGVIGLEIANIFHSLGSKINIIEILPNLLNQFDSDIAKRTTFSLKKRGIKILTSTKINSITTKNNKFSIEIQDSKKTNELLTESILISTGRNPYYKNLFADNLITTDNKKIIVNNHYQTNIENIYAIGDANGINLLAHAASKQAIYAVEKIMDKNPNRPKIIPNCIFLNPEIATVGISEDEAKKQNKNYIKSKFMMGANGKALSLNETEGFVKVIADADNYKILGVHIMGPHASDLIHEAALAIENNLTAENIINTIHAHPTLSEAFLESIEGLKKQAIHMAPQK